MVVNAFINEDGKLCLGVADKHITTPLTLASSELAQYKYNKPDA